MMYSVLYYMHLCNTESLFTGFPPKPTTTPRPTTTADPITTFCDGKPDGLYPNPADETTYFQCYRGNTYLHKCQPGLVFVDNCKCCDYPWVYAQSNSRFSAVWFALVLIYHLCFQLSKLIICSSIYVFVTFSFLLLLCRKMVFSLSHHFQ